MSFYSKHTFFFKKNHDRPDQQLAVFSDSNISPH